MRRSLIFLLLGFLAIPVVKPVAPAQKHLSIIFYDPLHNTGLLKDALSAVVAYDVSSPTNTLNKEALLITTVFDDQVRRHLQSGGRAIVLCNSLDAFPEGAPFKIKTRDKSARDSWIKIDAGPFSGIADMVKDKKWPDSIEPKFVVSNVRNEISDDVFARVNPTKDGAGAITAMQMYAAGGRVFVTTFQLETYGHGDYETRLLDGIIAYTMGLNFSPKYDWHIREE